MEEELQKELLGLRGKDTKSDTGAVASSHNSKVLNQNGKINSSIGQRSLSK